MTQRKKINRGDVETFLTKIKSPLNFMKGCKKFHEEDPRDIAYVISWETIRRRPKDLRFILAGAKLMIITWNAMVSCDYLQTLDRV